MLWNVAFGGRSDRRQMSAPLRLHAYVCKTHLLDEVSVNELFDFAGTMVQSGITISKFHTILLSYKYAVAFRERKDGSLRGMLLLNIIHSTCSKQTAELLKVDDCSKSEVEAIEQKQYTLIQLGLALFQPYYRGGPLLYFVTAYHIMKELVLHPFTPLYVVCKLFSYKSYVALARILKKVYPRHNAATPPFEKAIIDEFGFRIAGPGGDVYNRDTCVLEREHAALKHYVAPITDKEKRNPHIRFFLKQNPGWARGHCLCVVAQVSWFDLTSVMVKLLLRTFRIRRNKFGNVAARDVFQLRSQYSFEQEHSSNMYAIPSHKDQPDLFEDNIFI